MLAKIVPSYLYQQYSDDDDLQALVAAQNAYAQQYLDWFTAVGLPVYTGVGSLVDGDLLDWVATYLYGLARPVLPYGFAVVHGVLNSYCLNTLPLNQQRVQSPTTTFDTTDDVYRRCVTWLFYKGDGKEFSVRWLKRRVMRFLTMRNGVGLGVDQTYRVSVTFGANREVNINLRNSVVTFGAGALNSYALNSRPLDDGDFTVVALRPFKMAPVFKAAVDAGVLELPFQYTWIVNI